MTLGLAIAAAAAVALNTSYLIQHAALAVAPRVDVRRPVRSLRGLVTSPAWLAGAVLGYAGLAIEAIALTLASVSIVQSIIAAGQVVVAAGSRRATGRPATRREVAGTVLMVVALCVLAAGLAGSRHHVLPGTAGFLAFQAGVGALAVLAALTERPALAGGLFYGATTVAMAALLSGGATGALAVAAATTGAAVTAAGFFCFQRALQTVRPVAAVALMTAGTNGAAIAGGVLVFHEAIGSGALPKAVSLAALAVVPVAALMAAADVSAPRAPVDAAPRTARSPAPPRSRLPAHDPVA